MSESRCCCNCEHCIRVKHKDGFFRNHCEIDNHYIGYNETFNGWCNKWKRETKWDKESKKEK